MKHLRDLMLLGFALSVPAAASPAWVSQTPTPTPMEAADALVWAALPWACGLNILAVLLGLYLILGRPAPAAPGNTEEERTEE